MESKVAIGDLVEFENGRDVLRGKVVALYVDPLRPEMEETWHVLVRSELFNVRARRMTFVLGSV